MATLPVKWELPAKFPVGTTVYDLETLARDTDGNPITSGEITLPPDSGWVNAPNTGRANANLDYIVLGPRTFSINRLRLYGGRRVAIIGGHFNDSGSNTGAITVFGVTQWLYIEGVHVARRASGDAFGIAAPYWDSTLRPAVYIQNCYITGVNGYAGGPHGDIFQQWGGTDGVAQADQNYIGSMNVYNTYAESGYQGWYFTSNLQSGGWPADKQIDRVHIERSVLRAMPNALNNSVANDGPKFLYYFQRDASTKNYPVTIIDCHLIEGAGRVAYGSQLLLSPSPTSYSPSNSASWTSATYNDGFRSGTIYKGLPSTWTALSSTDVGAGYAHATSLYETDEEPPPPDPTPPAIGVGEALFCASFKREVLGGIHDLDTDTLKMALYSNRASLHTGVQTYSPIGEVSGTGYTAGGATITGVTITTDGTTAIVDANDVTWSGSTITAAAALIYNASKANRAVMVIGFSSSVSTTNGTLTVALPTANATSALLRG
jgi:hypothetical protein